MTNVDVNNNPPMQDKLYREALIGREDFQGNSGFSEFRDVGFEVSFPDFVTTGKQMQ